MARVFLYARPLPLPGTRQSPLVPPLEAAGYSVMLLADGPPGAGYDDVVLALGNLRWFPGLRRWLRTTPPDRRPLVAVWHTEPLPLPNGTRTRRHARELAKVVLRDPRATDPATNYAELRRLSGPGLLDLIMVGGRASRDFLRDRSIPAEWVPLGYHTGYGRELGVARDIDVMFLGATDVPRRRRALRRLMREGVAVSVAGSWRDPRYWGEHRTQLLNRVRILLNLPRRPGEMSGQRLLLGMANGALVISEPIYDSAPFIPGEHYVSVPLDEMPAAIGGYLDDEKARECIAAAGRRFATSEVTLDRSVRRLLEHIERRRRARAGT